MLEAICAQHKAVCSEAYCAVIVGVQVFQGLHEAPAHVACLCSLDSSVHQALPACHGVEEELGGAEAAVEGGGHKALALRCLVAPRKVRQTAVLQHSHLLSWHKRTPLIHAELVRAGHLVQDRQSTWMPARQNCRG